MSDTVMASRQVTRPKQPRSWQGQWQGQWQLVFLLPALLFLAFAALYPIFQLLLMSVSEVVPRTITKEWPLIGLKQFETVMASDLFKQALLNTVVYTLIVVFVSIAGGIIFALGLSAGGALSRITLTIMLIVWLAPTIASALVWKFMLSSDGAINSLLAQLGVPKPIYFLVDGWLPLISAALVNCWVAIPFTSIVFRAALLDIPSELIEQARIDGATGLQLTGSIVLPLLIPTIAILGCLTVVYAFKSFDFIFVMTGGGPGTQSATLPFISWKESFVAFQYGRGAAMAVIAMLIVFVFSLFYVRSVVREISA